MAKERITILVKQMMLLLIQFGRVLEPARI